jgi:asparagine synthase (glutamine-hydrolysing)
MKEYFRTDYLEDIFRKYEAAQGKEIRWPNYHNSKANRILFLLTLDVWHGLFLNGASNDSALPTLDEYLA